MKMNVQQAMEAIEERAAVSTPDELGSKEDVRKLLVGTDIDFEEFCAFVDHAIQSLFEEEIDPNDSQMITATMRSFVIYCFLGGYLMASTNA